MAGALVLASGAMAFVALRPSSAFAAQSASTYNINTLAGKVASLRGTAGLQIRFSAFIEQEAEETSGSAPLAITPAHGTQRPRQPGHRSRAAE
jgi:hypothetical protein